jgi:hypothetical protein
MLRSSRLRLQGTAREHSSYSVPGSASSSNVSCSSESWTGGKGDKASSEASSRSSQWEARVLVSATLLGHRRRTAMPGMRLTPAEGAARLSTTSGVAWVGALSRAALHFRQALVRQLRRGEWRLLLLASVSSSIVRRRGLKVANRADLGLRAFSFNGPAIGVFAAIRLRGCRTCNKKIRYYPGCAG